HHYYLNAQQTALLLDLVKTFQDVWMTLPLTHSEALNALWEPLVQTQRETYIQLKQLCQSVNLTVSPDWDLTEPTHTFAEPIATMAQRFKTNLAQVAPKNICDAERADFNAT